MKLPPESLPNLSSTIRKTKVPSLKPITAATGANTDNLDSESSALATASSAGLVIDLELNR